MGWLVIGMWAAHFGVWRPGAALPRLRTTQFQSGPIRLSRNISRTPRSRKPQRGNKLPHFEKSGNSLTRGNELNFASGRHIIR
jgi:hypothetical protein